MKRGQRNPLVIKSNGFWDALGERSGIARNIER